MVAKDFKRKAYFAVSNKMDFGRVSKVHWIYFRDMSGTIHFVCAFIFDFSQEA